MKKLTIILAVLTLTTSCFAQDTIVFKDNSKPVLCKIRDITPGNIFYIENNEYKSDFMNNVKYHSKFVHQEASQQNKTVQEKATALVLPTKEIKLSDEMINMRYDLDKCHKEYKTGLIIAITGTSISSIAFAMATSSMQIQGTVPISIIGGIGVLVGEIIMIDSHKWLNRASIGIGGNGVIVKYIL